jgi:hypothetical protein
MKELKKIRSYMNDSGIIKSRNLCVVMVGEPPWYNSHFEIHLYAKSIRMRSTMTSQAASRRRKRTERHFPIGKRAYSKELSLKWHISLD